MRAAWYLVALASLHTVVTLDLGHSAKHTLQLHRREHYKRTGVRIVESFTGETHRSSRLKLLEPL
jgi:hypothetical protein